MTEEAELQARIAAIAGKINQRKQQPYTPQPYERWAPYGRTTHKNRTLIVNPTPTVHHTTAGVVPSSESLVKMRGTNKQLMTKDTYEREQKHKQEIKEQHRAVKRQKRNAEEQHRILRHVDASGTASRELVIEDIRFTLTDNGSKLTRVPGRQDPGESGTASLTVTDFDNTKETPKRAKVAGVEFYRTKHGNLIRASALTGASRCATRSMPWKNSSLTLCRPIKQTPQCELFTKSGMARTSWRTWPIA